jgi:hypothetical protein
VKGATTVAKEGKKNKTAEDPWAPVDGETKVKKEKKDKGEKSAPATSSNYDDLGGPGSGSGFTPEDYEDALLLVSPLSLEEGIKTTFGEKEAIKADIVVLNKAKPEKSEEVPGALVFPKVLQGQLQQALARRSRVVGTLVKDVASQKPGQKPPWRLTAPSDDDIQVARKYLDSLNPLR